MPSFLPGFGWFAAAGLIAASGPIIIHLLNRRRFRVLDWAAMEFLREAVQRNRRVLQLRDLLLLLLRTACVLLFGLALARPFFSTSGDQFDADQPVHAVLLVDNSLSMGYQHTGGTTLDGAKDKAAEFIDDLPEGSRVSVIPVCGTPAGYTLDAYRSKEDARDALEKIEVVDRKGPATAAADLALSACQQVPEMAAKRVIFLGDQQRDNWPSETTDQQWKQLPELQVVDVSPEQPQNTWVASLELQDAIADVETPTAFTAEIRHEGDPRPGVQVTLSVDGVDVATQTFDLDPGQSLTTTFNYRFDVATEPGRPSFVAAKVSVTEDELPEDDVRHLVVPVVAALPVVFIDQLGQREKPEENLYGATFHLRRLLAPLTTRNQTTRQFVQVRHTNVEDVNRELLEDARLVVMAGVANPEPAVHLLREYVLQGGQLVIAAGADFDPAAWNQAAWLDGAGILPVPLEAEPVGNLPGEVEDQQPFRLEFESLKHDYFILPDVAREELADLYNEPFFFKTVRAVTRDETRDALVKRETERLAEQLKFLSASDANRRRWAEMEARGKLDGASREARKADETERAEIVPDWLLWEHQGPDDPLAARPENPEDDESVQNLAAKMAARGRPTVLARYDTSDAFMVERAIGRGRVLLVTSGVFSEWNTLPTTNTILLFDRILRSLLESTLPQRNYESVNQVSVPVRGSERRNRFELTKPDGSVEELIVEALEADSYGLTLRDVFRRGTYVVTAYPALSAADEGVDSKLWEIPIAVNGPESESKIDPISDEILGERMEGMNYRWVSRGDDISLEGAQVRGQDLWWWLILLVLICLLAELLILAWPSLKKPPLAEEQAA